MERPAPFSNKWVPVILPICTALVLVHGMAGARMELHALRQESIWSGDLQMARTMRRQIDINMQAGVADPCAGVVERHAAHGHALRCEGGRIVAQADEGGGLPVGLVLEKVPSPAGPSVWRCRGRGVQLRELPHACFP